MGDFRHRRQAVTPGATSGGGSAPEAASGPTTEAGYAVWRGGWEAIQVLFTGRGSGGRASRRQTLDSLLPQPLPLASLQQIHSARVLEARAGSCGEGDALTTRQAGLVLSVATADCVPVLLGGAAGVAAVHAGWRGVAAGVVTAAVASLGGDPASLAAWIGPAIGPCCYEVGEEVAAEVAAASHDAVVRRDDGPRPYLDLQAAVGHQLSACGVQRLHTVQVCTRCHPDLLWSYRRLGSSAGRNLAFVWTSPAHGTG